MHDTYDYVIVGAGTAGCVLAYRLSEDPNVRILVVESGPDDDKMFIKMPMGIGKIMILDEKTDPAARTNWGIANNPYMTHYAASPGGNRGPDIWFKGRTLGGSSSVNGMVYIRGTASDYDGWKAVGCEGWGWDDIGRCFTEIENHELGPSTWRGGGGPLRVTLNPVSDLGRTVIEAVAQAGTPSVSDINDVDAAFNGGFGPQPRTIWRGKRFSAATAFLRPAMKRPNVDVVTSADVVAVEFDGSRASGVRVRHKGQERSVTAAREVILSAGAIHSPKILQLSGIGPASLLKSLGIPVRVDASQVGKNLQEHRTIQSRFRLKEGGINSQFHGLGLVRSALEYFLMGRGPLSYSVWEVGGFVKTLPDLDQTDCQIGVGLFTLDETGNMEKEPGLTMFGYLTRPKSRGELAITSTNPLEPPRISANFFKEDYDRRHTIALYRYMRKIAQQPALAPYLNGETMPGPNAVSDDDLAEATYALPGCGYHICGTCRMGTDSDAVLDPKLRVRGVSNLRVVDTSMMPTLISGNTNGPAMAVAWRASEFIKAA